MACAIGRQEHVRADEDGTTVPSPELEVVSVGGHGVVGDGAEAILRKVGAREDAEHARARPRVLGGDCDDARVRVRRAHDRRVDLAGQREVVAESPATAEQAIVLLAPNGLADWTRHGEHAGASIPSGCVHRQGRARSAGARGPRV